MNTCVCIVQAPCQHNFCLGCFNRWVGQGKKTCPTCRHPFPAKFAANPRINTLLASAIRMAKLGDKPAAKLVMVRAKPDFQDPLMHVASTLLDVQVRLLCAAAKHTAHDASSSYVTFHMSPRCLLLGHLHEVASTEKPDRPFHPKKLCYSDICALGLTCRR